MTDSALYQRVDAATARNPFVPISDAMRVVVVIYFVFWRILPSIALLGAQSETDAGYAIAITVMSFATNFLILLPFLMGRFAGTPIGWLHPLILPTMISVAFGFLRNPGNLLTPVTVWSQAAPVPDHVLLTGWPEPWVLEAQLRLNMLTLLALICTYAGFAMVRHRRPATPRRPVRVDGVRLAVFFALCLLVVLFFLQKQGGIVAHMSTLGGGRFRMRELSGHFLVLNGFLPYVMLLWYAYRPKSLRNPVFLAGFAVALVLQFVVTGSRSGLFIPVALLLAVWIFHNRRLPATRALLLGMVAVLMLGVLGEVRRSGRDGEVDFTALLEFDIASAWEASQEEQASRSNDTGLAVTALVPERRDHLYGTTYVAAVLFWVPRALWRDKPRGAGAHASALLFKGRDTMDGYSGGGYPVNGAPEAYWNFGYAGVVAVYALYGMVLSAVAGALLRNPANPFALMAVLIVTFQMATPNTTSIVSTLQSMVLLYLLYLFVSRFRLTG